MLIARLVAAFLVMFYILSAPANADKGRIVAVMSDDLLPYKELLEGFQSEMKGYSIKVLQLRSNSEHPELDSEIYDQRPEFILCAGMRALDHVSAIKGIPKIYCLVTHAAALNYQSKTDIAGVCLDILPASQFKILKTTFPIMKRIGAIYDPTRNDTFVAEAERNGRLLNLQLVSTPVRSIKEIPGALYELDKKIDIFWTFSDRTVFTPETSRYILLHSLRKKIPLIGFSPQFAKAGALMAIYGNYHDMGRQAALLGKELTETGKWKVRHIEPRQINIAINMKVANVMGVSFPESIIMSANETY